ncbi:MAG: beta-phosphoglucomutase family hydrolase [Acidobacteria bacterium]|nr:beta-phosphoglucomutase family hydrolase [Acidobacteriota bacterium]
MSSKRALIFDMDGVLIDSSPSHREAWDRFNLRYGLRTDEAMHQRIYGKRNDDILRDFFGPELSREEVFARGAEKEALWREMVAPRLSQCLVPGVRTFLERHRHRPMGLGTNAEPANVDFLLDGAGLRRYFRAVVDGHQVSRPKPDPEIYRRVAELLGMDPRDCVIFEDSYSGVQAARAAGAKVVAVRTTHREFKEVDLTVDHFLSPELEPWLAGLELEPVAV